MSVLKTTGTLAVSAILAFANPAYAQENAPASAAETAPAAPIAPDRLEAANAAVDYLFPLGTYERMMKGTMDQIMDTMMENMGNMKLNDLAAGSGVSDEQLSEAEKELTLAEMVRKTDPYYDERMKISTRVMMDEMVDLMSEMEPEIRAALTNIYARKFTAPQLNEMNAFFATPTGGQFAKDYMMVFVDPEMMQSMTTMVPKLMGSMGDIMEKVGKATAHLPPVNVTNPATADVDVIDAVAEAADSAAVDAYEEPEWEKPENWTAAERARVDKLENDYAAAEEAYFDARSSAIESAAKRLEKNAK